MGGYIGLDVGLLRALAGDLGVARDEQFYAKLRTFELEAMPLLNKQSEGTVCTDEDKKKCKAQHGDFLDWACSECEKNPDREIGAPLAAPEEDT